MKRHLLIDADIVAFTIACRCTQVVDWDGDGTPTQHVDEDQALFQATCWLSDLKRKTQADTATICLSDVNRKYFRHKVYSLYKAKRTHGQPPAILPTIKGLMRAGIEGFTTRWVKDLEADDLLGILGSHPIWNKDVTCILATSDKDLQQIAGEHFNVRTEKTSHVTQPQADFFFWQQCLSGDSVDGIPGCPGIGPKRGEKIVLEALKLDPTGNSVWPSIVGAYERAGLDEEYALCQARCVRILRWNEYDYQRKEPILWTPPFAVSAS